MNNFIEGKQFISINKWQDNHDTLLTYYLIYMLLGIEFMIIEQQLTDSPSNHKVRRFTAVHIVYSENLPHTLPRDNEEM